MSLEKTKSMITALLAASLLFSESLKLISIFALLLILLVQLYRREVNLELSTIHFGFLLLVAAALTSSIFAVSPVKSLKGAEGVFYYTVPFFVASSITNEKHIRAILWSLYLSTAIAALLALFHTIAFHKPIDIHPLGNQNYIAMFLIIIASSMFSTLVFSDRETKYSRIFLTALLTVILVASVMTAFRASFISFFLLVLIVLLAKKKASSSLWLAAALAVLGLLTAYLYEPMWKKLFLTKSFIYRLYIWEYALAVFRQHPITGAGLNHFAYHAPPGTPEAGGTAYDAHNIYLQTASQMGLLGLISLSLIIYGFLHSFFKSGSSSNFADSVRYSALGGFLVTFISGLLDTTLHRGHAVAFTLLAGLMIGLSSRRKLLQ